MAERPGAIVVFGAPLAPDGSPGPTLARRLEAAATAAARWPALPIIVSGGPVRGPRPEAHAMRAALVAAGISPARLMVEDAARHTLDTAWRVAPLLHAGGIAGPVVVVTSGYHALRCRASLRAAGVRVAATVVPPAERRSMGSLPWIAAALREIVAMPWCLLRVLAKRRTRE